MLKRCSNLANCAFFKTYFANSETVRNSWIKFYCADKVKSETCERKKLKNAGKIPPDNMAPTGKLLQKVVIPK
jgi:hypothetical protein